MQAKVIELNSVITGSLKRWWVIAKKNLGKHITDEGLNPNKNQCVSHLWSRYLRWNYEIHLIVKKRTSLMDAFGILSCMEKFSENQPILDDQSEDSYMAWLDRKHQDVKEPWLFYGEDEDFINVVWNQFASTKQPWECFFSTNKKIVMAIRNTC